MKRWIILFILAALLLTGCTVNQTEGTKSDATLSTTVPDPGLYVAESSIERQTAGAVRQYALQQGSFCTMDFMGADVLIFSRQENGIAVQRLTGRNCSVAAESMLPASIYPNRSSVRAEGKMLAYYNATDNSVVYLNEAFQETGRRSLPHAIAGAPVLGRDLYSVYYNAGTEIYAADLRAGIARLVRQYSGQSPVIRGTILDDTVLVCDASTGENPGIAFISSVTGSPLGDDMSLSQIYSNGQNYLLRRMDGITEEILFGVKDSTPSRLLPKEPGTMYSAVTMNGAVVTTALERGSTRFSFYHLATGKCISVVTMQSIAKVLAVEADNVGHYVWIVAEDIDGNQMLLRWDVSQNNIKDEQVYTYTRYTLQNPDVDGLAQCRTIAQDISQRYGVDIAIVDGVRQPLTGSVQYEYQVQAIQLGLASIDAALQRFPEDFLSKMKTISCDHGVHIGLVRSVQFSGQKGAVESDGLQYWLDGEAYIALVVSDDMEKSIIHQISHVLDTYIFANSVRYDEWEEVNPAGFQYDENYTDYLNRGNSSYLKDGNRCFIDAYSMSFAKEDRARILEYAMTDGNEALFSSTTMQTKLLRVCRAIRDAFDWKKDTRTFPWEQYLNKSLAYVEKSK